MSFSEVPIGAAFDVRNGATPASGEPAYWDGDIPWVGPADLGKLKFRFVERGERSITPEGYTSCGTQMVPEGTIILSIRAPIGHMAIASQPMCFNQGCRGLVPRPMVRTDFAYWSLLAHRPQLEAAGQGTTFIELGRNKLRAQRIRLPDLDTQKAVADFLDFETARIDQLIEKKQRLAELLGEKLEDDILRAVTLGIDLDVELIPEDELEWTTHRPKHWKLFRLKHFFRENTQYSKDGQETLFSLRMKEGLVPHNDVSDKEIPPSDLINYKKVFPGQIVMNRMRAAIGLFGLADSEGIVSPDYSIFDVSPKAHAAYFLRLFKSEPMMAAFRLLSKGLGTGHSGFMRLNADNFGRIRVAAPELEEQRLISNYVENRIAQITKLQVQNEQSIERLKEFRAALITAAVTGQIDVTTWAKQGQTDRRLDQIEEDMSVREARA